MHSCAIALVPPLVYLTIADLTKREIPDAASLMVAVVGIGVWSGMPEALFWNTAAAVSAVLVFWGVSEWAWRKSGRDFLGIGDVKLIGAGLLVVGAEEFWMVLLLAATGGIVVALLTRREARVGIPFGPFLAYAIFITFLIANGNT